MSKRKHELSDVLDAINGEGYWAQPKKDTSSFGNIGVIARRLGVSRTTVYSYLNEWATAQKAVDEGRELLKDFAEGKIAQHISEGNVTMLIFYAKTQMKDRGYIERQDIGIKVEEELDKVLDQLEHSLTPEIFQKVIEAIAHGGS